MYSYGVKAIVSLSRIVGRKDRAPRVVQGEICVTVRERGGRSVRVMSLCDSSAERPGLAELWEPQIMSWNSNQVAFQGYEDNAGQWSVQTWVCELPRPQP